MKVSVYSDVTDFQKITVVFNESGPFEQKVKMDRSELRHVIEVLDKAANYESNYGI